MLGRIALGVKTTAKTAAYSTVTALALGGCYAVYEVADAGQERLKERFAPVRERYETTRDRAENEWDKLGASLGRLIERAERHPELLLTVVLPLLVAAYYRRKGHSTGEAVFAAVTRTAPVPLDIPLSSSERARNRVTLRELRETLKALDAKALPLAKDVQTAERNLEAKRSNKRDAEEFLAEAERDVDAAVAALERLCDAQDAALAEAHEVRAEIAALEQRS